MSIYDVAKKAGVSVATVSRVINGTATVSQETREKVLKVIRELDYVPNGIARSLATNKTESIGIMVSNIRNYFDHQLAYELEKNLNKYGMVSILCNTTLDTKKKLDYLYLLREKKVDAIITVGSMYEEKAFLKELIKASNTFPVIMINAILDKKYKNVITVSSDEQKGIIDSVKFIKARGYKNPIYIYPVDSMKNRSAVSKRKAFKKAIELIYPNNEVIEFESSDVDCEIIEVIKLLRDMKADAIQFENDNLAIQYYKHFISLGIDIPGEIAIVGFDNIDSSNYTQKAISSIDQQLGLQAKIAVESLEKLIKEEDFNHETIVDTIFLAKETT
ncbi:MAG: LacI family DNA-binding transcriptional regulator [Peptoniphilaceae bacterium]|nr:LacI family DNA-binding transcriptional regulator [Peptoniphilaceae bacterium]MDY6019159.1 LacI family DNA-binding transcriptional regulator [Anaerococcus sp.]